MIEQIEDSHIIHLMDEDTAINVIKPDQIVQSSINVGNPESLHQVDHKHETLDTILTTIQRHILSLIQDLVIPPFAAFNSLIQDDINIILINIFKTTRSSKLI